MAVMTMSLGNVSIAGQRTRRLAALAICATGFTVLFAGAKHLAGDLSVAGLSDEFIRGMAHFCGFGLLALILARAIGQRFLLAWLVSMVLATGEEVHQLVVPFRCSCPGDWLINAMGISTILIAGWLWHRQQSTLPLSAAPAAGTRLPLVGSGTAI
ncbi:MAG: hypothetical protein CMJ18_05910 [Phycisphaeraceae bacterium]|nr:hypothetical protein [Phycisphaeraceae bacterium]